MAPKVAAKRFPVRDSALRTRVGERESGGLFINRAIRVAEKTREGEGLKGQHFFFRPRSFRLASNVLEKRMLDSLLWTHAGFRVIDKKPRNEI